MSLLTDPRYHKLQDWADYTVFGINGISQQNPPSPYQFDDWREWALRFYQVLD
jgi:hypothetical protein